MRTPISLALSLAAATVLCTSAMAQEPSKSADVPVRQVVLFSSGVGYFEHDGAVRGAAATELRFKTTQINDILKSLVLQDEGGGSIGAVTYPSLDPLEKTLGSFSVDISGNPSLSELLNQLRGAHVTLRFPAASVEGTILGVEEHEETIGNGDNAKIIKKHVLNLVTSEGMIRAFGLENPPVIQFTDPQLQAELGKALAALAQARDQEKKAVTIQFNGEGERRVRIGYVIETPIWKTSYRLVLGASNAAGDIKADAKADDAAKLQGWAIVENQTDTDWKDIALSLVSGRPISFVQDLYQPLYIQRPVVQPELYASLKPQTYSGGISTMSAPQVAEESESRDMNDGPAGQARARSKLMKAPAALPPEAATASAGAGLAANGPATARAYQRQEALDVTASVASAASATNLGELFQYSIPDVTLARQRSAMLPILNDPVRAERLSIYNRAVLATHPLNGVRLTNTTGKHLLQGPITVFAENSYAGDARIEDTPPGQSRLLSFGIDLPVTVNADKNKQEDAVQSARIVKGALELQRKLVFTQDYLMENKGDQPKKLVIEHPFRAGWKLVNTPPPVETTETLYRFETNLPAKKTATFTVSEETVSMETIGILPIDFGTLEIYSRTGKIPADVKAALAKAIAMKRGIGDTETQLRTRRAEIDRITKEQSRIRENLKTVAQNSDYSNRLLKKLNDQETQIEGLQKEADDLQHSLETQRRDLETYLGGLNVG